MLKIAGAALNQMPMDWKGNTLRLLEALRRAQQEEVDVLCFAELALTGYGCEDLYLTDACFVRSWELLERLMPAGGGLFFAVGMPLLHKGRRYNTLALVADGELVGFYAKHHLARDGVYYEPRWFEPWPKGSCERVSYKGLEVPIGAVVHGYKGYQLGFEICEDLWQPMGERPADAYHKEGVDVILSAHASHFALGKHPRRRQLIVDSAGGCACLYVYVNTLGNDAGRLVYDGDVMFAAEGAVVAAAERLCFGDMNFMTYCFDRDAKAVPMPLADAFASEEEEFTQAAALALFDYLRKSRTQGFVLSASGGADSSMCAVLVAEMLRRALTALGAARLQAFCPFFSDINSSDHNTDVIATSRRLCAQFFTMVYQASAYSSSATEHSAHRLATDIGARYIRWSIDDEVKAYVDKVSGALGRSLSWERDDLALQNVQARARTPGLWLLANVLNALLLTTSNRSEGSVGYTTMDGDTAGSLAPLASVSKVFIMRWLRWAQRVLGYESLAEVNSLRPTAELRPAAASQSDETDLMPYDILLAIERAAIFERRAPADVLQKLIAQKIADPAHLCIYVDKFFRLWARNQWKRERLAPSFHLDAYSIDPKSWYRFPILSAGYQEELVALNAFGGAHQEEAPDPNPNAD